MPRAARNTWLVAASHRTAMSVQACLIAWLTPMGLPNCTRVRACSADRSRVASATPAAMAAASTAPRAWIGSSVDATGVAPDVRGGGEPGAGVDARDRREAAHVREGDEVGTGGGHDQSELGPHVVVHVGTAVASPLDERHPHGPVEDPSPQVASRHPGAEDRRQHRPRCEVPADLPEQQGLLGQPVADAAAGLGQPEAEPALGGARGPHRLVDAAVVGVQLAHPGHGQLGREQGRDRRDDLILLGRGQEVHQRGNPSRRSPMMLRMISEVPPPMEYE